MPGTMPGLRAILPLFVNHDCFSRNHAVCRVPIVESPFEHLLGFICVFDSMGARGGGKLMWTIQTQSGGAPAVRDVGQALTCL